MKDEFNLKLDSYLFEYKPNGWTRKEYIKELLKKDIREMRYDPSSRMCKILSKSEYSVCATGTRHVCANELWAIFHIMRIEQDDESAVSKLNDLYKNHPQTMMLSSSQDKWSRFTI